MLQMLSNKGYNIRHKPLYGSTLKWSASKSSLSLMKNITSKMVVMERNFLCFGVYHNKLNDTRNQSIKIFKRNKDI